MKSLKNKHAGIIGLVLIVPALTLASSGILYSVFGLESANGFIDAVASTTGLGFLFSPFIIMGGPLIAFILNAPRFCRLEIGLTERTATISLSIKGILINLIPAAASAAVVFLILLYGFVENYQIIMK